MPVDLYHSQDFNRYYITMQGYYGDATRDFVLGYEFARLVYLYRRAIPQSTNFHNELIVRVVQLMLFNSEIMGVDSEIRISTNPGAWPLLTILGKRVK